jgi:hypothetical protein
MHVKPVSNARHGESTIPESKLCYFNSHLCTSRKLRKMMDNATLHTSNEQAAHRRAQLDAIYEHSTSYPVEILLDSELTACKPRSEFSVPAPTCFTRSRGSTPRRSSRAPFQAACLESYAAHRATVGRMIAKTECAAWTETSSWESALERYDISFK